VLGRVAASAADESCFLPQLNQPPAGCEEVGPLHPAPKLTVPHSRAAIAQRRRETRMIVTSLCQISRITHPTAAYWSNSFASTHHPWLRVYSAIPIVTIQSICRFRQTSLFGKIPPIVAGGS